MKSATKSGEKRDANASKSKMLEAAAKEEENVAVVVRNSSLQSKKSE
jgi:hypothetical protein